VIAELLVFSTIQPRHVPFHRPRWMHNEKTFWLSHNCSSTIWTKRNKSTWLAPST